VSVWDQRAGRTMKSITVISSRIFRIEKRERGHNIYFLDFRLWCSHVNMQRDWVCVGDGTGKLHLLDLKNDSELVKSYSIGNTRRICGVHMTHGCLITAGPADGTVKFSSLTDPSRPIVTLSSGYKYVNRVSITRIYIKKNDFDKVLENLAKSTF